MWQVLDFDRRDLGDGGPTRAGSAAAAAKPQRRPDEELTPLVRIFCLRDGLTRTSCQTLSPCRPHGQEKVSRGAFGPNPSEYFGQAKMEWRRTSGLLLHIPRLAEDVSETRRIRLGEKSQGLAILVEATRHVWLA